MRKGKIILIVLDSVGVGFLPDAHEFGDVGANTLGNIASQIEGFKLPNLQKLGIGNLPGLSMLGENRSPTGAYGRAMEVSKGKDTTTGHWEIAGIPLENPFKTFPNGFPLEIISEFEDRIGRKTLANSVASGTVIIEEYGERHMASGKPIVYTSADSVFQVAMHESVIDLEEQYRICEIAREILQGPNAVGRVIARPFVGTKGNFERTSGRKDFTLIPPRKTMLDYLYEAKYDVISVGKIFDIYSGRGISQKIKTKNNQEGIEKTLEVAENTESGLIFTNLVDFDMLFGHRNNVDGYANALIEFDSALPAFLDVLNEDDLLIITADHGCDPTFPGTDHTREYIPIICCGKKVIPGGSLGTRSSFADIGKTVCNFFGLSNELSGEDFIKEIF